MKLADFASWLDAVEIAHSAATSTNTPSAQNNNFGVHRTRDKGQRRHRHGWHGKPLLLQRHRPAASRQRPPPACHHSRPLPGSPRPRERQSHDTEKKTPTSASRRQPLHELRQPRQAIPAAPVSHDTARRLSICALCIETSSMAAPNTQSTGSKQAHRHRHRMQVHQKRVDYDIEYFSSASSSVIGITSLEETKVPQWSANTKQLSGTCRPGPRSTINLTLS